MRVATFDIGTNNVLMLVAERRAEGLVPLLDLAEITRLGRGVDRTHRLDDAAVARTLDAITRFWTQARELGVDAVAAVATSATRDAANGPEFRDRVRAIVGADVEIVSGAREAALTFAGAISEPGLPDGRLGVIDVGGGSTEIVVGDRARGEVEWAHSYDVGSVRLFERHLAGDPPLARELADVDEAARRAFASAPAPASDVVAVVALAGTATTYADVDAAERGAGRFAQLSVARIDELRARLARLPLAARLQVRGLDPGRADVIVAGGACLAEAARALGARSVWISDRGVRYGLARERATG